MTRHGAETTALPRRGVLAGGLATMSLGLAGSAIAQPRAGGKLRVASLTNPSTLDPMTGRSGFDHIQLFTMFDTLIEWDYDTLMPLPGLATAWRFPDPKTLVLTLREGVVFHDGSPFDAEAVRFNLDRSRLDQRSNIRPDLASVQAVEVTGPFEVTLRLNQADTALPLILADRAGMMVSPKAVKENGPNLDRRPVGSGPWKFVRWADNERVSVSRNERYWKPGQPLLDEIEFNIILEANTALRSVLSGENDFVYDLSLKQKPVIDRAKNLNSTISPTIRLMQLYFNGGRGPLSDVRVRRAINHAIDRDSYNQAVSLGLNETAAMALPKSHWAYNPDLAGMYPYDPAKARALLAEAGVASGLEVRLLGWSDQDSQQQEEILIDQFKKAGITIKLTTGAVADITNRFDGDKQGDMMLAGWSGRPDPTLTYLLLFGASSYYNPGGIEPAGFADAIARSRSSSAIAERTGAFRDVQRLVMENALFAPIMFQAQYVVTSKKVQGYRPNLLGKPKFNDVYLAG